MFRNHILVHEHYLHEYRQRDKATNLVPLFFMSHRAMGDDGHYASSGLFHAVFIGFFTLPHLVFHNESHEK